LSSAGEGIFAKGKTTLNDAYCTFLSFDFDRERDTLPYQTDHIITYMNLNFKCFDKKCDKIY